MALVIALHRRAVSSRLPLSYVVPALAGAALFPGNYTAYTPGHDVVARGRFFDYDFSRTFDDALWQPRNSEAADWDTSSSYNRSIAQAGEPERS